MYLAPGVSVVEPPGVSDGLDDVADRRVVDVIDQDAGHAEVQARAAAERNRKSGEPTAVGEMLTPRRTDVPLPTSEPAQVRRLVARLPY